jgi:hypothetical protein
MTAYQELLRRRKDRACAIILSVKEREVDPFLESQTSEKLRKVVLDQVNEFYEVVRDVVAALEDGSVEFNELWLDRLGEIYEAVVNGRGH